MEFSIQLVNQVLESKLFKGMNFDLIELILEIGKVEHFKKGEILMREGDQGDTFYWVKSGKLEVQTEKAALLEEEQNGAGREKADGRFA